MIFRQLDEALILQICNIMTMGTNYDVAAVSLGCLQTDAVDWIEKGHAAEEGIYFDLFHSVCQAQAIAQVFHMQKMIAEGGAAASKWILQKTDPEKWGDRATKPKKLTGPKKVMIDET